MDSHQDVTGSVKSLTTTGTSVELSTNSFSRRLAVDNTDETEIADAEPSKGQGSDLTPFATLQLPDQPVLYIVMDRVAKLDEATDTVLTTVTAEIKSEVGRLESRLTDLRNQTNKRFTTQTMRYDPFKTILYTSLPALWSWKMDSTKSTLRWTRRLRS